MDFPLFVLPFDHRTGFAKELLSAPYPLSAAKARQARALKALIFEAFLRAPKLLKTKHHLALLVDEDLGAEIIPKAKKLKLSLIVPVEKSGGIFSFEYGKKFADHLKKVRPSMAKALVRYNLGDEGVNRLQRSRLKELAKVCKEQKIPLMLEVLLTGKEGNSEESLGTMFAEFQNDGIQPEVWKLEGISSAAAWRRLAPLAKAPIILLGRGESKKDVEGWVKAGAESGQLAGFAIGRTIFLKPLQAFQAKKMTRKQAVEAIAENFVHFIHQWERYAA